MATLGFTPATGQDCFSIETTQRTTSAVTSALRGEEAREFYEKLITDGKAQDLSNGAISQKDNGRGNRNKQRKRESVRTVRRRLGTHTHSAPQRGSSTSEGDRRGESQNTERSMELMGLRLLHCAHEGNISGLKDLLSKGADINFQDTFFWTAMMCASWSGQTAAVRLLLRRGAAWVGVVDTQGKDAKDLALEAGHLDVLEELDNYGKNPPRDTRSKSVTRPHWCDVCRTEYSSSPSAHLSSTLHQFSLRHPPPTPHYCLPPSSTSYRMMVRCGWKPGAGLGPEGEGRKQPVSTVLKRDQKGLGYGPEKRARVTHFQARDQDAVKLPYKEKEGRGRKAQRQEAKIKEQKDKTWERDFRTSFYL